MHTSTHTHSHTHTHTHTHAHTHSHSHACMHACTHTHTHTNTNFGKKLFGQIGNLVGHDQRPTIISTTVNNEFNKHFTSIAKQVEEKLLKPKHNYYTYLTKPKC